MTTIHGKRLNEVIGSNYSEEEIPTVLRAALEVHEKKKLRILKNLKNPLFAGDEKNDGESDDEDRDSVVDENAGHYDDELPEDADYDAVLRDNRVQLAVGSIKQRNLTFTVSEKRQIIIIFDIIKKVMLEQHPNMSIPKINVIASEKAAESLSMKGGFGGITSRKIHTYNRVRNFETTKRGVKVNEEFENEVMGSMVMAVYTKALDKVCFCTVIIILIAKMMI